MEVVPDNVKRSTLEQELLNHFEKSTLILEKLVKMETKIYGDGDKNPPVEPCNNMSELVSNQNSILTYCIDTLDRFMINTLME